MNKAINDKDNRFILKLLSHISWILALFLLVTYKFWIWDIYSPIEIKFRDLLFIWGFTMILLAISLKSYSYIYNLISNYLKLKILAFRKIFPRVYDIYSIKLINLIHWLVTKGTWYLTIILSIKYLVSFFGLEALNLAIFILGEDTIHYLDHNWEFINYEYFYQFIDSIIIRVKEWGNMLNDYLDILLHKFYEVIQILDFNHTISNDSVIDTATYIAAENLSDITGGGPTLTFTSMTLFFILVVSYLIIQLYISSLILILIHFYLRPDMKDKIITYLNKPSKVKVFNWIKKVWLRGFTFHIKYLKHFIIFYLFLLGINILNQTYLLFTFYQHFDNLVYHHIQGLIG